MKRFLLSLIAFLMLLTTYSRKINLHIDYGGAQIVTLDGSQSFDPDGSIASWQWAPLGTLPIPCDITNATSMIATVVPSGGKEWAIGTYTFELTVTDNQGAISKDQVNITVVANPDKPPMSNAGSDQTIQAPVSQVTLNGNASVDPDGKIVFWQWSQISGPNAGTFTLPGQSITQFIGLIPGIYTVRLKVADSLGSSAADTVVITVKSANAPPKANAGQDQTITLPVSSVAIGGLDSPDKAQIAWTKISGPGGDVIMSPSSSITQVKNLSRGQFVYKKTVTSLDGLSASDSVIVNVKKKCSFFSRLFGRC